MNAEYLYKKYIEQKEKLPEPIETDEQKAEVVMLMKKAAEEMRKLYEKYNFQTLGEYKAFIFNQKYNIGEIRKFVESIYSTPEKLIFLHQIKSDYERELKDVEPGEIKEICVKKENGEHKKIFDAIPIGNFISEAVFNFGDEIDLEIKKYEKILELEKDKAFLKKSSESSVQRIRREEFARSFARAESELLSGGFSSTTKSCEREKRQKELGLTEDRATLFLGYLFKYAGVKCRNTEKAKVISFLTGYSETKIAQAFSNLEKEKLMISEISEMSKKNFDDLEIIRKFFKTLKLSDIERMIDEDLGTNSE